MVKLIDLRSDTVTKPTEAMRQAMCRAEVGDDVYGEDPTVRQLEEMTAELFGKEAALFMPSGTMGNQVAILTHTNRGEEIIIEAEAHVYFYEVGGIGALAGVLTRTIRGNRGVLPAEKVREAIRLSDIHFPMTSLICLENTHKRAGGTVTNLKQMEEIGAVAKEFNIAVHLDGARIFNAAVALGVGVKELTKDADTVMFSLSKGLAAPVGSMLTGSLKLITKARRWRKMLGGGMHQSGILAAAGIVALEQMVNRLEEDHQNAQKLAEGLSNIAGIEVDLARVQTNIVVANLVESDVAVSVFINRLNERGIRANSFGDNLIRFVTHKDISTEDIENTLWNIQEIMRVRG